MDEKTKKILEKDRKRGITKGAMLSAVLVSFCVGFGIGTYVFMAGMDENIAYLAMFMDNTAADLYTSNASQDSVNLASGLASSFCRLYGAESRTVERGKFDPLCEAINARSKIMIMCGHATETCPEYMIKELDSLMIEAEPLARYLTENPPYFRYAFKNSAYFAGKEVKPIL